MYRCCIFDLDGTIINTLHSLVYTVNLTMETYGYGPLDEEHIKIFVGDGYQTLIERTLTYCGDEKLEHMEEALASYRENFKNYCLYQVEPYEGVPELLSFLKQKGIKLGVVSNKGHDRAVECVEAVYGKGFFDKITGEGEGIKCKPDPSGVLMTAEFFDMAPEECLYFGDTNTDMMTGRHAGMDTAGVLWGFRSRRELEEYHPKYLISQPQEILSVFE